SHLGTEVPGRLILSKRDPPKSRLDDPIPGGIGVREHSAAHVSLSSIFSCQRTDIADAVSWPGSLLASGLSSVAHAALLNSVQPWRNSEANFFVASSVAAVVGEAYIVGT